MELNPRLDIDFLSLEENWREQPIQYMEVSEKYVDASAKRDMLKLELEERIAELDEVARRELAESNSRVTESMVSNYIIKHDDIKKLKRALIELNKNVNLLASEKSAFEHRKKALECLVQLYATSYFTQQTEGKSVKELENVKTKEVEVEQIKKSQGTERMRKRRRPRFEQDENAPHLKHGKRESHGKHHS